MFLHLIDFNKEKDKKRDAMNVILFLGFDTELMHALKLYGYQLLLTFGVLSKYKK